MIHAPLSRRRFLGTAVSAVGAGVLPQIMHAFPGERTDQEIFREAIAFARAEALSGRPLGDIMLSVGRFFLASPYVAHTLEEPGEEHLVINLRGFDCLTFVENTLAISRCIRSQKVDFNDFRKQLTLIRYRSGKLNGYASRLHYFTDWIADNAAKGVVRNITPDLGGTRYTKTINFMTTHRSSYAQLTADSLVQEIAAAERRLSDHPLQYVSRKAVKGILDKLQSGDIIGTTTSMEGMDVSHTGMVIVDNGVRRFLHASLSGKQVMIATGSLADYIDAVPRHTGIVVARPVEIEQ